MGKLKCQHKAEVERVSAVVMRLIGAALSTRLVDSPLFGAKCNQRILLVRRDPGERGEGSVQQTAQKAFFHSLIQFILALQVIKTSSDFFSAQQHINCEAVDGGGTLQSIKFQISKQKIPLPSSPNNFSMSNAIVPAISLEESRERECEWWRREKP